jgi:translation initiation factor IF-3
MNDQITTRGGLKRDSEIRLLGPENEQMGIMTLSAAQKYALDSDLDLVLMVKNAAPPVCRAMDYGKYNFERDKKEKEAKKNQHRVELKEIQLSYRIDQNDLNTKAGHARRFLESGNKVKVVMRFRGREISHQQLGMAMVEKFRDSLADVGMADKKPAFEGRSIIMFLVPNKADNKSKDVKNAPAAPAVEAKANTNPPKETTETPKGNNENE